MLVGSQGGNKDRRDEKVSQKRRRVRSKLGRRAEESPVLEVKRGGVEGNSGKRDNCDNYE